MDKRKIRSLGRRKKGPITQLNILWHEKREKFKIKELIFIAAATDCLLLKKKVVTEFLNRGDANFDDFYCMIERIKEVLEKYKGLKKKFWKECFALCTIDNLAELTEAGETEATTKLLDKTEDGSMRNNKAKQVLIRLFERFTDEKTRMNLWERIKKHDPDKEELRYILDLPSMYSLFEIRSEAEKLLRQKYKTKENKNIKRLLDLAKKTKKGQE